ncbi:MAG: SRPBCC family protein [Hyphomonadaceae bacterium]
MTTDRTVRLHRVLPTKPEKVYKAFVDADAKARWLPPNGFTCKVHSYDPRVGGAYKMSLTNFSTGNGHSWTGKFLDLVPGERVVYADTFDDPNMPGEMVVTVTLKKVMVGTELRIEQTNVPEAIPLEGCYLGWQESLEYLAKLVTPEIPD